MKYHKKRIVWVFLGMASLCIGLLFLLQWRMERMATHFLARKLPRHLQLNYKELDVHLLTASLSLDRLSLDFFDRESLAYRGTLIMDQFTLKGFHYWQYFVDDDISWDEISLHNPDLVIVSRAQERKNPSEGPPGDSFEKSISIGRIRVTNGKFTMLKHGSNQPQLRAENVSLEAGGIRIDSATLANPIPLAYKNLSLSLKNFHTSLGTFEEMTIAGLNLEKQVLEAHHIKLYTKYGKRELSGKIDMERDHISLAIPKLQVHGPTLDTRDAKWSVAVDSISLQHPSLDIYRDKLVADDTVRKKMYSQMIRNLPFRLTVPLVKIQGGHVGYEEKVDAESKAGRVTMDSLQAELRRVSNTYVAPGETEVHARALFMGSAPVSLDWRFDVNNPNDFFTVSGSFTNFEASSANRYLEANMNVRISGVVDRLYFTASGDADETEGDLQIKYRDFNFQILKENGSGFNKLLTALASLLVKQNKNQDSASFRYGHIKTARDHTKSFFNYLWLIVRSGIRDALTGDGKKHE